MLASDEELYNRLYKKKIKKQLMDRKFKLL